MGFLDKARAAATDLAAKADTALSNSGLGASKPPSTGDADAYFRDLGVLTYLEASGRAADADERVRVMAALQQLEANGTLRSFVLHTAPPPAPGTAGAGTFGAVPPPPGVAGAPVPPPHGGAAASGVAPPASTVAPPPPPSWMTSDGTS